MPSAATVDVSLYTTTEAALANQEGDFLYSAVPTIKSRSKKEGVGTTSYNLESLHNALLASAGYAVDYNESAPAQAEWDEGDVDVKLELIQTAPLPIPDDANGEMHRLKSIQNVVPIVTSMAAQAADRQIISALTGTGMQTEVFSGTGVLSIYPSDANPAMDIRNAIIDYRPYQGMADFELVAYLDEEYMNVLAGYTSFQVRGMNFDSDGKLWTTADNRAAFSAAFAQAVGVDRVVIRSGAYNSAIRGATPVIERLQKGLLWIGIVDTRQAEWDLNNGGGGPSGAIAFATNDTGIYSYQWNVGNGAEENLVNGRINMDVVTPLYTAHGITAGSFWPDTEVFA